MGLLHLLITKVTLLTVVEDLHGTAPGQLVVYPIIHWNKDDERSVSDIISKIESWVIAGLETLGIVGYRDERMQGVWVDDKKICSIGLSFLRWVSRHGFTINYDTPIGRVERTSLDVVSQKRQQHHFPA